MAEEGGFFKNLTFAVKGEKGVATGDGWVKGTSSVGTGLGLVGGRFELDPEQAESMVKTAQWIADRMRAQAQRAEELVYSKPPADDPASVNFQSIAVKSFELGASHVEESYRYHREVAEKLAKALDVYNGADQQSAEDVKKSGGGMIN